MSVLLFLSVPELGWFVIAMANAIYGCTILAKMLIVYTIPNWINYKIRLFPCIGLYDSVVVTTISNNCIAFYYRSSLKESTNVQFHKYVLKRVKWINFIMIKGKAVFCEKPIAETEEGTRACYEAARKANRPLFCSFNR